MMACRDAERGRLSSALMLFVAAFLANGVEAATIEKQRGLFMQVYADAELGDWSGVDKLSRSEQRLLKNYVLWPDLRAAYLRVHLRQTPAADIESFVDEYSTLKPARDLRYRYALQLARSGDLEAYQHIYERYYQGQNIAKLDCLSLQADLKAGRSARVTSRAKALWLVGKSQVSECDPVFDDLKKRNLLGPDEYRERFALAIDARSFSLARWLAKNLDKPHQDEAARWLSAHNNPEDFLNTPIMHSERETAHKQLAYAAERLTYRDPAIARKAWQRATRAYPLPRELKVSTDRHIALWTARDNLPAAYELLAALPRHAQDDEVVRWRARTSLRSSGWEQLLSDIGNLSEQERGAEEWQYWRAIALQRSGQASVANEALLTLSKERSYYGFLAADELGEQYAIDHAELAADEPAIAVIAARPEMIRARELFLVGLDGRGRSEWDAVVRNFSAAEKRQAAILADRWGWHSRAIATAASLGEYDDLSLRYPLPFKTEFEASSSKASISPTWAYGIARSETLFMRDVRSSAGAIGLMQLMPATGRSVAKALQLHYTGLDTLTDPENNIRLGTGYLGQMEERYGGNLVLATAAYNAGPHRVDRWLPESGSVDARVWIENIPFNETRKYVKRVLAAQAIFHWRMTGKIRRLSDELVAIRSAEDTQKLAAR
ncbi:MAG: transglycosylase SLT domain-containing protein [Woeseiaceae bacterium]